MNYYGTHPDSFHGHEFPKIKILRESFPKSRKDYKCSCCGKLIKKGTKYYLQVGTEDEKLYQIRQHLNGCL
jgi:hypothetical protein